MYNPAVLEISIGISFLLIELYIFLSGNLEKYAFSPFSFIISSVFITPVLSPWLESLIFSATLSRQIFFLFAASPKLIIIPGSYISMYFLRTSKHWSYITGNLTVIMSLPLILFGSNS